LLLADTIQFADARDGSQVLIEGPTSNAYAVAPIGVRDKEGVNRTRMTRTGADHRG